jgi:hydroxymethylpyrimidine pyrophosphatase-like HAD family hydrolase
LLGVEKHLIAIVASWVSSCFYNGRGRAMKLTVLALDYDGTIARDGEVEASVRESIAALRSSGTTVLLVTGRILDELRGVAGDLRFVDGVVAENGAVVYLPESDYTTVLAPRIPDAFLAEITRRGIPFQSGHCLVDADADESQRLLEAIRACELPLVAAFNQTRVMIVSQGVSKATGLHASLDMLRLSARNTLAIGDAENDHELLRFAEVGAAVEWGSEALKSAADLVVAGSGPEAIAAFLSPLAATRTLPRPARARRHLRLGHGEDGREIALAVRERDVLIAGDAKSGKSWMAGLLCEQLILLGYCVCVLDPEGDYRSLEALPGVSVLGGEEPPPTPRQLLRALRYPDRSAIIDLSHLRQDQKIEYARAVLPSLTEIRRSTGLPHRIVIDEAHYFLHDADADRLLDFDMNGYIVVTHLASRLPPRLLEATEVIIVTCESNPVEVDALWRRSAPSAHGDIATWRRTLGHLPIGRAVIVPLVEEAAGLLRPFVVGRRLTSHVRHREKYVDVPVTDSRAFLFAADRGEAPRTARTLREFVAEIERAPIEALRAYLRRGDFSRWIGEVFGDHALASELLDLEERHRRDGERDVIGDVVAAVRRRYDLSLGD